jgi:hypothetical protein
MPPGVDSPPEPEPPQPDPEPEPKPKRFLEVAKSKRPITPWGPEIVTREMSSILTDTGTVVNPTPPPIESTSIRFLTKRQGGTLTVAEFADTKYTTDIGRVASILKAKRGLSVKITADVGYEDELGNPENPAGVLTELETIGNARAGLVQHELIKTGISPLRFKIDKGAALEGDVNQKVHFYFFYPRP